MSLLRRLRSLKPVVAGLALLVSFVPDGYAQAMGGIAGSVSSTIRTRSGDPVPGVTIRIPELRLETETDDDGRFSFLALPAGRREILAEILGCQLGSRTVVVRDDEVTYVDFNMDQPVIAVPGLVVSGLSLEPSDPELPYSVGRLDPDKLDRHPGRTIADLLRGEFPGVKIVQGSGLAGEEISIQLRGRRSISTPQEPLVVLDGVITGGGSIDVNPRDVEDILVLKGSAASAQYGSRGQAGVIEITTRQGGMSKARARRQPVVLVDGTISSTGLDQIDPAEIESMELMSGAVARLLFGRGAPEAGLVEIRTRQGVSGNALASCFEPSGPSR